MRTRQWAAGLFVTLIVVVIIVVASNELRSDMGPGTTSNSTPSSPMPAQDRGKATQDEPEVNQLTDHDTNHDWLVNSATELETTLQRLPSGGIREEVTALLDEEKALEARNERKYRMFLEAARGDLESWAVDDLKFGNVTAERFAAVSVTSTNSLFDEEMRAKVADNPVKNVSERAQEASIVTHRAQIQLNRTSSHPEMLKACPEDLSGLKEILLRAQPLLSQALDEVGTAPTLAYVLLAHAEMLISEVDARNTCFRGWDNGRSGPNNQSLLKH